MLPFLIIYSIIYLCVLISYFFSETSGNHKRRAINKIILASLFYILALFGYAFTKKILSSESILIIGITFCYLGDILLLKSFTKGGISFLIGNVFISSYLIIQMVRKNVTIIYPLISLFCFIIVASIFMYLVKRKILNLRNMVIPITFYILSVTLHGMLSIPLGLYTFMPRYLLMSLGLVLYMISDYFLMTHKFKYPRKKWILRCNSGTYFIGMLFVAISYFI